MMRKKFWKQVLLLTLLFLIISSFLNLDQLFAAESAMPEPPSDEQKEEWTRMGDENAKKYGTGSEKPTPTVLSPTAKPTVVPSAMPTEAAIEIDEESASTDETEVESEQNQNQEQKQVWYQKLWQWFKGLF